MEPELEVPQHGIAEFDEEHAKCYGRESGPTDLQTQPIYPQDSKYDELRDIAGQFPEERSVLFEFIDEVERAKVLHSDDSALDAGQAICEVIKHSLMFHNPRIALECYLLVLGKSQENEVEVARRHGVTKAYISKMSCEIRDWWGLIVRGGRSAEVRKKFSERILKRKHGKGHGLWKHSACKKLKPQKGLLNKLTQLTKKSKKSGGGSSTS